MLNQIVIQGRTLELLKVSAPLMLSFLSILGMTFVDRLFLANYSVEALSAMSSAGTLAFSITFSIQNLTLIASVFVAQLNGAKKYAELGSPVWQMFWFALATYLIFIPLSLIIPNYLFTDGLIITQQKLVFKCIMLISPLFAMVGSLQSFYNGQGKTLVITYLSIIGNIVNIILAPLLIFGFKDIIPSLGIIGANIATACGLIVQIFILFILFLSPQNRINYGTNKWQFNLPLLKACLRIGSPEALAFGIEICCWGVFYNMIASISKTHILITAITQSISLLLFFFVLSIGQSTSIVGGNFIGAKRKHEIHAIFHAGCLLILIYTISIFIALYYGANFIMHLFFYTSQTDPFDAMISTGILATIKPILHQVFPLLAIYLGFESTRFMINGLLKAAGDTIFLLYIGVINVLVFLILPTYVLITMHVMQEQSFVKIWLFFAVMSSIISYLRFRHGAWKKMSIMG
jgi:MATE family multidrug resistance protein